MSGFWDKAGAFVGSIFSSSTAGPVQAVSSILDHFCETPEEKNAAAQIMAKIQQQPQIAQQEINKVEAASRSTFVAGWRPFIGWVCGISLGTYYIPQFLLASILWWKMCWQAQQLLPYPIHDISGLNQLLYAMLGLGAYRTIEKFGGKTK